MKPHAALAERLAETRRFDQLIALLRDELDWPIGSADFEDLTFEYDAEELGIDKKSAAKIEEIKRLRPLVSDQPWGIFFVKFEPKRLPVVALRRILGAVAVKKRASANSAERAAWATDDLLFVSNYGEGDERQINFAHFARSQDGDDLPTLKVLGWDDHDTSLHLDAVAQEIQKHLSWPQDPRDIEGWRQHWRAAFTLRHREVVATSRELAIRLASLARTIRDRLVTALEIETEQGPLSRLMKAFQESLVDDLDIEGFADMYAQTIAYGLLSARIADPRRKTTDDLAAHLRTSPFLRELMEIFLKVGGRRGKAGGPGIDFDELGVSEVVELLDNANMEAVLRDFGDRNPQEDPVIYFYEFFLEEFDSKKRMQRGVVYTPRPVVSYIVQSVDETLRTEFGLRDGLADTTTWGEMASRHEALQIPIGVSPNDDFVKILDLATGTGTFLVAAVDRIFETLIAKWRGEGCTDDEVIARWNQYVPRHLLPRLHGFELMMAPYAIAHLSLGLKLYETGYRFLESSRAQIYLTNSLEPPHGMVEQLKLELPALAAEAAAVDAVKAGGRFTVILGNPPYAQASANLSSAARGLVERYRYVDGTKISERSMLVFERNIQDDYVKFMAVAESLVLASGSGIVGLVTNHSFLDGPTLRGLRGSLLESFSLISCLDLHGNINKRERSPEGNIDQNVFDIRQGVAVTLLARPPHPPHVPVRRFGDLWGSRVSKYEALAAGSTASLPFAEASPRPPFLAFRSSGGALSEEYEKHIPLTALLVRHLSGTATGFDGLLIDFDRDELRRKLREFWRTGVVPKAGNESREISLTGHAAKVLERRGLLNEELDPYIGEFEQFPFDVRYAYLRRELLQSHSAEVMESLGLGSPGLVATRQTKEPFGVFVVAGYCGHKLLGSYDRCSVFPSSGGGMFQETYVNVATFEAATGLSSVAEGELFAYIYGVLHSPGYRARYKEMLRLDFPRVPAPSSPQLFRALASAGETLVLKHLMLNCEADPATACFRGPADVPIEKVHWQEGAVWIDRASQVGFENVPIEVWEFHVGGYRVCEKWLKDRRGRTLSATDILRYQRIVAALADTICLMQDVEKSIESHGGWPDAFIIDR